MATISVKAACAAFATYQLVNMATGISLYETFATPEEIVQANHNLRERGIPSRFLSTAVIS